MAETAISTERIDYDVYGYSFSILAQAHAWWYIHIKEFEQNQVVAISQVVTLEKGVNTFMCLF